MDAGQQGSEMNLVGHLESIAQILQRARRLSEGIREHLQGPWPEQSAKEPGQLTRVPSVRDMCHALTKVAATIEHDLEHIVNFLGVTEPSSSEAPSTLGYAQQPGGTRSSR